MLNEVAVAEEVKLKVMMGLLPGRLSVAILAVGVAANILPSSFPTRGSLSICARKASRSECEADFNATVVQIEIRKSE